MNNGRARGSQAIENPKLDTEAKHNNNILQVPRSYIPWDFSAVAGYLERTTRNSRIHRATINNLVTLLLFRAPNHLRGFRFESVSFAYLPRSNRKKQA